MKKKLFCLICLSALILCLCSCQSKRQTNSKQPSQSNSNQNVTTTTAPDAISFDVIVTNDTDDKVSHINYSLFNGNNLVSTGKLNSTDNHQYTASIITEPINNCGISFQFVYSNDHQESIGQIQRILPEAGAKYTFSVSGSIKEGYSLE